MHLMARFLARRLVQSAVVVFILMTITFFLTRAFTDPVRILLNLNATEEDRARLRHFFGLDKPLFAQFRAYMSDLIRGDFGESLWQRRDALEIVMEHLPPTLLLAGTSIALAV